MSNKNYGSGYGNGNGYGSGAADGNGSGSGDGVAYGDGNGSGSGSGNGYGEGYGEGLSGDGEGYGSRYGVKLLVIREYEVQQCWPGYVKTGCQVHTENWWREHWRQVALDHEIDLTTDEIQKIESLIDNFD